MHQRGGLECLTGRFVRHFVRGQPPQLPISQRQQFVPGLGVALFQGSKNLSDLVHLVSSPALEPPSISALASRNKVWAMIQSCQLGPRSPLSILGSFAPATSVALLKASRASPAWFNLCRAMARTE